ncbi:hypothetical protein ABZT17_03475 [Streptomyces sp. NPDC005648]|uniref:hypothetical protein n=1 Tax=Streptomyces sp. NPDC005648 TaxID=3157044 RepID=UPI0033AC15A6
MTEVAKSACWDAEFPQIGGDLITWQSIRRGTFSSVHVLVKQIRDYIDSWNENPKPFTWTATATADEILAKVRIVQTSVRTSITTRTNTIRITGH